MQFERINQNNIMQLFEGCIDMAANRDWEQLAKNLESLLIQIKNNEPSNETADALIEKTEQINDLIVGEDIPSSLSEKINNLLSDITDNI